MLLGLPKLQAMLESCSQEMQAAGPNPALPHQQIDTGSISVCTHDLVGFVDDVRPPRRLFLHPWSWSSTANVLGQPTQPLPARSTLCSQQGCGDGRREDGV